MTNLSDIQLVILEAACQRPNRIVLPLPDRLKGGAARKVVDALISRGLIEEVEVGRGDPVWREADDGRGVTLVATDATLEFLGIEAASRRTAASRAALGPASFLVPPEAPQPPASPPAPLRRKTREGTKHAQLVAMLRWAYGATIAQIVEATGWQPHTVRGALAGALKRLGLDVAPTARSRAARDERSARGDGPGEVAADWPAQLEPVARLGLIDEPGQHLSVLEPLDREREPQRVGWGGDRVAPLRLIAVIGGEPDIDVLSRKMAGPARAGTSTAASAALTASRGVGLGCLRHGLRRTVALRLRYGKSSLRGAGELFLGHEQHLVELGADRLLVDFVPEVRPELADHILVPGLLEVGAHHLL